MTRAYNMEVRGFSIPDEDLNVIAELAKTMLIKEIADKWDVHQKTLQLFLKRHGTTPAKIKHMHRIEFYDSSNTSISRAAKNLGISVSALSRSLEFRDKYLNN